MDEDRSHRFPKIKPEKNQSRPKKIKPLNLDKKRFYLTNCQGKMVPISTNTAQKPIYSHNEPSFFF